MSEAKKSQSRDQRVNRKQLVRCADYLFHCTHCSPARAAATENRRPLYVV